MIGVLWVIVCVYDLCRVGYCVALMYQYHGVLCVSVCRMGYCMALMYQYYLQVSAICTQR